MVIGQAYQLTRNIGSDTSTVPTYGNLLVKPGSPCAQLGFLGLWACLICGSTAYAAVQVSEAGIRISIDDTACPGLTAGEYGAHRIRTQASWLNEVFVLHDEAQWEGLIAQQIDLAEAKDQLDLIMIQSLLAYDRTREAAALEPLETWIAQRAEGFPVLSVRAEILLATLYVAHFGAHRTLFWAEKTKDQVEKAGRMLASHAGRLSDDQQARSWARLGDLLTVLDSTDDAAAAYRSAWDALESAQQPPGAYFDSPMLICLPPKIGPGLMSKSDEQKPALYFDLEFDVKPSGEPSRATVSAQNAAKRVRRAALLVSRYLRFRPAMVDGSTAGAENYQLRLIVHGDCNGYRSLGLTTELQVGCY